MTTIYNLTYYNGHWRVTRNYQAHEYALAMSKALKHNGVLTCVQVRWDGVRYHRQVTVIDVNELAEVVK